MSLGDSIRNLFSLRKSPTTPQEAGPPSSTFNVDPAMFNPLVSGPASAPISMPLSKEIPTSFLPEVRHAGVMFPSLGPEILQPPYNPAFVAGVRRWSPEVADSAATFLERMFRQAIIYEPKFARRCEKCDMDYDRDIEECEICGKPTREPDAVQENLAKRWLKKINGNGQTLAQFARVMTDFAITFDDSFLLRLYDYELNGEGEEVKPPKLKEFWPASSERMRLIFDTQYRKKGYMKDAQGKKHGFFTCVLHRERLYNSGEETCEKVECRLPVHPCVAVGLDVNGQPVHGYLENEVLHWSPRNPGPAYGFSRIASLETVIKTVAAMDAQEWLIYAHDRPPKGFIVFNTDNPETLQAQFRKEEAQRGQDPNHIPKFALQSASKSGGAQFISLTPTYDELQNIDSRKDKYRRIWSSFEVEPIFMADTSAGGGLNNEGRQLTVNLQAVESLEGDWHEVLFPFMEEAIGLTDYRFRFPEPAEKDKAADTVLRSQNLQHRMMIETAGGQTERMDEDTWEFQITEEPDFSMLAMGDGGGAPGGWSQGARGGYYQEGVGGAKTYGDPFGGEEGIEKSMAMAQFHKAVADERRFFSDMSSHLQELLDDLVKNWEQYATPGEQKAAIKEIVGYAVEKMATGAEQDMIEALWKGMQAVGVNPAELGIDMNAIRAITQQSPVWKTFANMSDEMSEEVGGALQRAFLEPQAVDVRKLTQTMSTIVGGRRHELRRIARTETNRVTNVGRELAYKHEDPEGEHLFKWSGGVDARTCEAHKVLIRESARNPQPINVLKARMQELGQEQMGPNWEILDWVMHPNQRGHIVRVV